MNYYFKVSRSWGWYNPFHYAPYPSDLLKMIKVLGLDEKGIVLEEGEPLTPLQQLLAVLPPERSPFYFFLFFLSILLFHLFLSFFHWFLFFRFKFQFSFF